MKRKRWLKAQEQRRNRILARYKLLRSFAKVGREFHLSRQRVKQIVDGD